MVEIKKADPAFAKRVSDEIHKFQDLNKSGGRAETIGNLLKGMGGEVRSDTQTELKAGLKGNIGIAKGEIGVGSTKTTGGSLTMNLRSVGDQILKNTESNLKGWNAMDKALGGGQGGATSTLELAHFDRGEWPFVPVYGLLYRRGAR
jgi:hypothetical protein